MAKDSLQQHTTSSLWLSTMLGAMRAGVAWSNLNMRAAPADILHILSAGRCGLLFFDPAAAPLIDAIRAGVPTLREVVCLGDDPRAPSLEGVYRAASAVSRRPVSEPV
jgi:hypothetical protein